MRVARLDLARFGRFTDHVIDFGPAPAEGPDLHVVYGPNEAGKSTLLAAWLDLLYGVPLQSRYAFLHPRAGMRIGARLETGGTAHELVRITRRSGSLVGPDGGLRDEGVLAAALAGVDRESYRAMFSLDDDTIESGGEAILESRGALGEMLFAASAGMAALGRRLRAMRAEADAFHRPKASTTELARVKNEMEEIAAERRALHVSAPRHRALIAEREAAREAEAGDRAASEAAQARREAARRRLAALGPRERLARLRAARDALPDHTPPPADWAESHPRLMRAATAFETRRADLEAALGAREDALAAVERDPEILALADRIDALSAAGASGTAPAARFAAAEEDLPNRRAEKEAAERRIAALRARLEAPQGVETGALLLPGRRVADLRALIARRSGVSGAREAAVREAEEAEAALRRARARPEPAEAPPAGAVEALKAARAAAAAAEQPGRAAAARARLAALEETLAARMAALAPWSGTPEALARLAPPEARRLSDWRAAHAAATRETERARDALDRARAALEEAEARRTAAAGAVHGISDAAATAAREARDAAWQTHRARLDAATAEAFAGALAEDDRLAALRLARAGDLAALRAREADRAAAQAARDSAVRAAERADARLAALEAEIAGAVAAMATDESPAPPVAGLDAFEAWLAARAAALETLAERESVRQERDAAEAGAREMADRLAAALAGAGADPSDETRTGALLVAADAALAAAAEARHAAEARRQDIAALSEAAETRARRRAEAERADAAWHRDRDAALEGTWLAALSPPPGAEALGQILEDLGALETALGTLNALEDRIAKMERDRARYLDALAGIADALGEPFAPGEARALAARLTDRLAAARAAEARHAECQAARAEAAEALAALDREIAVHRAEVGRMTAHFGVATLAEAGVCLDQVAERRALSARIAEERAALAEALGLDDPDAAEAELAGAERGALEAELHAAESELGRVDAALSERVAARVRAEDAVTATGADDRVAALEQRRRVLAERLAAGARKNLALRLGLSAAGRALALYRERHRSAMLADASRAFALITNGTYSGLAAQPGADGEDRLVALAAGGGSRLAPELSKGTRFQLYLALRVAGYRAFAENREPLPFVADDIMETFDDDRAGAALALMAEMAGTGQVICLTHHRHLCDIARAVCPQAVFHRLPDAPAAAPGSDTGAPRRG